MSQQAVEGFRSEWHSYRCPVCGHTDEVDMTGSIGQVVCTHCGTTLEVESHARDAAAAAAKVAARRPRVH